MKSKQEKQELIGKRLYDLLPFWERDNATAEDLTEQVKDDPEDIILYLLDYIEDN